MEETIFNSLNGLTSNDNDLRGHAEAVLLRTLDSDTQSCVHILMSILGNAQVGETVRSSAGVLLRRALEAYGTSSQNDRFQDQFVEQLKTMCLHVFVNETSAHLLRRIAHIIAQLATIREWPSLLPTIVSTLQSTPELCANTHYVRACLSLVEILSEYVPECVCADVQLAVSVLGPFLGSFFSAADIQTQVFCARATAAVIVCFGEESEAARNAFRPALQPIIKVVGDCLQRGDELDAVSIMENLVELVQIQPLFLKGNWGVHATQTGYQRIFCRLRG
jgi:hypothetical protein